MAASKIVHSANGNHDITGVENVQFSVTIDGSGSVTLYWMQGADLMPIKTFTSSSTEGEQTTYPVDGPKKDFRLGVTVSSGTITTHLGGV